MEAYKSNLTYLDTAHKTFLTQKFFGSLDGLRCLSILAVIWHHTAGDSFTFPLSTHGNHGVTLFFAISGFLITTLLLREKAKTGEISLKKFYIRRTLRIFPLYYAVLFSYIILVFILERDSEFGKAFMHNLPAFLTYTSNWFVKLGDEKVIFYFAWSLATEEQFYLVWPWVQKRFTFWTPVILMSILLIISYFASSGYLSFLDEFILTVLSSIMPGICLGAILAHLLHHKNTYPMVTCILGRKYSPLVTLAALLIYLSFSGINIWTVHFLSVILVGSCVCREDHHLKSFFQIRSVQWIGTISYGMYMVHMLAKNFYNLLMEKTGVKSILNDLIINPNLIEFIATTALTIMAASIIFKYYESIFLKMKHKFSTL